MVKNKVLKFITGNKAKVFEARATLTPFVVEQLNLDLAEIQELDSKKVIEHKLSEALKHHKGQFFIDDSSVFLKCLNNKLPGPYIKSFLSAMGPKGIYELCKKMGNFEARAITYIGFLQKPEKIVYFEGKLNGKITKPKGSYGFGYDQIFVPAGYNKTMSEMKSESNFGISPRGIAIKKLKKYLEKNARKT